MRNIRSRLHRPVAALRRVQELAGLLGAAAGDRNENRAAQIESIRRELFDLAVAALNGGPLPPQVDHRKAV
jgi:hypothetical protein